MENKVDQVVESAIQQAFDAHVGGVTLSGEVQLRPADKSRSRVYCWPKGESILQNFIVGRRTRPETQLRKVMPEILKQAAVVAGVELNPELLENFSFSSYAGCSTCPCSPGFILSGLLTDKDGKGCDVHVHYTANDPGPQLAESYVALAQR